MIALSELAYYDGFDIQNKVKNSTGPTMPIPKNIGHYYNLEETTGNYKYQDRRPTHLTSNYMCGPCNKSFFTNGMYQRHLEEHIKCPFPECQLTACMKVIDQHISHQHMMVNFENLQVDDEKWIEDRKKRFPTIQRAEQRRSQQIELLKRGERMGFKRHNSGTKDRPPNSFGRKQNFQGKNIDFDKSNFKHDHKNAHRPNYKELVESKKFCRSNTRKRHSMHIKEYATKKIVDLYDSDNEIKGGVKAFQGMNTYLEKIGELSQYGIPSDTISDPNILNISDDEDWNVPAANKTASISNALGSLMGMYCSSDEENKSISKFVEHAGLNKATAINAKLAQQPSSCLSNESEICISNQPAERKLLKRKSDRKFGTNVNHEKRWPHKPQIHKKRRKSTLLEKLLQPDIKHERNVILQCIRFILNENYFESRELK